MKKFLTHKEAADYLGISENDLGEIVKKGKLPSYKIGGIYTRFKVDELNSFSRKVPKKFDKGQRGSRLDRVKDFFYFNDFYIFSFIAIVIILYVIFR